MIQSFSCFSQRDTLIILNRITAKKVITDLYKLDYLTHVVAEDSVKFRIFEEQLSTQDSLLESKNQQIKKQQGVIALHYKVDSLHNAKISTEVRRSKKFKKQRDIVGGALVLVITLILLMR